MKPASPNNNRFLAACALASLGLVTSSQAASLTQSGWAFLHSQNNGLTGGENLEHNISVYAGSAGYAGSNATGGATSGTFGDGTVVAYSFFTADAGGNGFNNGNETIVSYAQSGGLITGSTTDTTLNIASATDLWTTTDPAGFTSTANFSTNTNATDLNNFTGSIDISGLGSGNIYFIYGHYRGGATSNTSFNLTMKDTQAIASDINLLAATGDSANNWEHYVVNVAFVNDAGYDTIDYSFNFSSTAAPNGRMTGIVMDGVAIPEPSAALLGGLGLLALLRRRR